MTRIRPQPLPLVAALIFSCFLALTASSCVFAASAIFLAQIFRLAFWLSFMRRFLMRYLIASAILISRTCSAYADVADASARATESLSRAILAACGTALLGAAGWLAAYILNGWRDDRTKRLQLTIEHTATQIRDFYAPLIALTDQLNSMAEVNDMAYQGRSEEEKKAIAGPMFNDFSNPSTRKSLVF